MNSDSQVVVVPAYGNGSRLMSIMEYVAKWSAVAGVSGARSTRRLSIPPATASARKCCRAASHTNGLPFISSREPGTAARMRDHSATTCAHGTRARAGSMAQ
jgi:hypothetical protein